MSYILKSSPPLLVIHIPKCAGQSVRKWIRGTYQLEDVTNDRTNVNFHSTIDDARKQLVDFEKYRSMAVIRNPWKRAFSWYTFRKHKIEETVKYLTSNGDHDDVNMSKNLTALSEEKEHMGKGFNNWLDRYIDTPWDNTWFSLAMPMSTWLGDHEFDLIVDCEENISQHVADRFPTIINNRYSKEMPRKNVSNTQTDLYIEHYNDNSKKLIERLHGDDIERFQYKFK